MYSKPPLLGGVFKKSLDMEKSVKVIEMTEDKKVFIIAKKFLRDYINQKNEKNFKMLVIFLNEYYFNMSEEARIVFNKNVIKLSNEDFNLWNLATAFDMFDMNV